MALEDEQLARLVDAAEAARGRYIALSLLNVTKSTNSAEGLTPEKLQEVAAAQAACKAADGALADWRAVQRWSTPRN